MARHPYDEDEVEVDVEVEVDADTDAEAAGRRNGDTDADADADDIVPQRPWKLIIGITAVIIVLVIILVAFYKPGSNTQGTNGDGDGDGNGNGATTNHPPRAQIRIIGGTYQDFYVNEAIPFDASFSSDLDEEDTLTYAWDFDDSNGIQTEDTGIKVNHTYELGGNFTITLTVSDGKNSSQDNLTIFVKDTLIVEFESTGEILPRQGAQYQLMVTRVTQNDYLNKFFFRLISSANDTVLANGSMYDIINTVTAPISIVDLDQRLSVNDTIIVKDDSGAEAGDVFELYYGETFEAAEKVGDAVLVITLPFM